MPLAVPFCTSYEHCPERQEVDQSFAARTACAAKKSVGSKDRNMVLEGRTQKNEGVNERKAGTGKDLEGRRN